MLNKVQEFSCVYMCCIIKWLCLLLQIYSSLTKGKSYKTPCLSGPPVCIILTYQYVSLNAQVWHNICEGDYRDCSANIQNSFPEEDVGPFEQMDRKGTIMKKVLIVDDNDNLASLLKGMLEEEGNYNVETAENGQEGYAAFLHFKPDVVLTDIEMPVKNGIDMVRNMRAHDPDIKTIYMSADMNRYRTRLEDEKIKYKATLLDKPFRFSMVRELFH
jgi:CheY-like chemotaxis protein